ncbi:hypothetical protein B0H14DRAFT_2585142 [Mycena olivaceomarginata]|nr:hypothetical protein B0H14DRAFT_2585142 [Mycena olivaceomarginata]
MASLDEHDVYVEKEGRVLDDDEKPVPDVISVGMAALTHASAELDDEYADLPALEEPEDSDDDLDNDELMVDEDLFAESPTLTRLDEGDVDLDMDEVPEWYLDDDDGEYSDDDSDDDLEA